MKSWRRNNNNNNNNGNSHHRKSVSVQGQGQQKECICLLGRNQPTPVLKMLMHWNMHGNPACRP